MAKELVLREGRSAPGGLTAPRVTVDEVLARLDRGEQIAFVDARREEEWRSSFNAWREADGPLEPRTTAG